MSRSAWLIPPEQPDSARLKAHGITEPVFDGRWLRVLYDSKALEYLKFASSSYGSSGAYFCSQGQDALGAWPSQKDLSGPEWADWVYETFQKKIAPGTSGDWPVVHLNSETDDVQWQLSMLKRWRQHSPRRRTLWLPVSHKANVFKHVAAEIAALNIIVSPQCYAGNMERVESANEVLAWASIGIPLNQIAPCLDAAQLGQWWGEVGAGAVAFTQGRLP